MSGIQRWSTLSNELRIASASYPNDDEEGEVEIVTYTDHAAYVAVAVAEAEQRVRSSELAEAKALLASRDEAWLAGLAAAREAVEALANKTTHPWASIGDALAAIDALRVES